jgi:hypothetical protein
MTDTTPPTVAKPPKHCTACGAPTGAHLSWCPTLTAVPVQTGWLCPACGRGNAPLSMICPCKGWLKLEVTC